MISRVYSVQEVELDTTINSDDMVPVLKVVARGMVNSGGWTNPELGPWSYIVNPEDGILDMDFLASPPASGTIVTMGFQKITANGLFPVPEWVTGIRVHSSTGSVEKLISGSLPKPAKVAEGLPLPWPFPWYRPQTA